ncbi:MAG: gliding motility protein [Myxococcaceae bacterium]|nr:gliding motility protein [Myxococcaceae bacterium]
MAALLAVAMVSAGCKKKHENEQAYLALGEQVAAAEASDLRLSPDGKTALFLKEGQKPRINGIPPEMRVGELYAVATSGGGARKLGNGVTNVPGGFSFSADSRWVLFLSGYNAAEQAGTLEAVDLSSADFRPVQLGEGVTYFLASPDSHQVAFVANGVLSVGPLPEGPFKQISGQVQTADFTADAKWLVFKRRLSAAGGLFIWPVDGSKEPIKLGEQVGDQVSSPDSRRIAFTQRSREVPSTYDLFLASAPEWKAKQIASGAGVFAFSPDSAWLGRTENGRPDQLGDLFVGPADGSAGKKIATRVNEFRFAPTSDAVAYLELFDISSRAGVLGVATLPDGEPKRIGNRAPNFGWAPDGKSVAFISRFLKPIYSVDLMLYRLGEEAAFKVNPGVFGYEYDPKGRYLVFRTNCLNQGRYCDLMKLDLAEPRKPPVKIIEGVYTFRPSTDGERILVTYARRDTKLYDAAVFNVARNERKTVAQFIELPALFDREGSKVVYIVGNDQAPGVYVASKIP